jgi:hypothetical protein
VAFDATAVDDSILEPGRVVEGQVASQPAHTTDNEENATTSLLIMVRNAPEMRNAPPDERGGVSLVEDDEVDRSG